MIVASVANSTSDIVLSGPLLLALLVAAAAGAVSFFSPCCLPLVPGYLSYVAGVAGSETPTTSDGTSPTVPTAGAAAPSPSAVAVAPAATRAPARPGVGGVARSRTVLGAVLFVAGFAAVFTSYGALFGAFGALLMAHQELLVRILGVITIVLGLMFTGLLWRIPLAGRTFRLTYRPRTGLAGAPLVGALFGLGWTPCIGPTLAAVLTLATSSADAGRGAALSLAYSAGLGIPFILTAISAQKVMTTFGWARRHARVVMRAGGALLIVLGLLQITGLWLALISRMQGLIVGWQVPL